jgi:hypothetical protein
VSYEITIDLRAHDDIAALPADALLSLAEAITFLQLTPWNTRPISPDNPSGPVRTVAFGDAGMLTVLVLDGLHRVDVLTVSWGR